MKIVAVSGWKRSGKDMVSEFLTKNQGFKRLAFADRLKDMAAEQYGIPRADFDDPTTKEAPIFTMPVAPEDAFSRAVNELIWTHFRDQLGQKPTQFKIENSRGYGLVGPDWKPMFHTPRSVAVFEGSGKRSMQSNYWVKRAVGSADPEGLYVISDLRFKSEIRQLIEVAGEENVTTLRIERFESTTDTDPSERDLDDYPFDFKINNKEAEGISRSQVFEQVVDALRDSKILPPAKLIP